MGLFHGVLKNACNILVVHGFVGMNLLLGFDVLFLLISVPWVKLSRTKETQKSVIANPRPPMQST